MTDFSDGPLRAVLFDAGNTLLFLDYERIAVGVSAALGVALTGPGLAAGAPAAACTMEGPRADDQERAAAYLEALFLQAGVPAERLGELGTCLRRLHDERHLWSSVADDAHQALGRLRAAGLLLGVVSNSDGRVESALEAAGLRHYFEVVVDSGLEGVEKPDPAIFMAALDALAVPPAEALYVGDMYEVDVLGANAAGIPAVLFGGAGNLVPAGVATVTSLGALADDLLQEELSP